MESDRGLRHAVPDARVAGFLSERAGQSKAQVLFPHSASGPEPLCACWQTGASAKLRSGFERGVRKVTEGIALLRAEVLDEQDCKRFDSAGRLFWNMNTAADYEEARRFWKRSASERREAGQLLRVSRPVQELRRAPGARSRELHGKARETCVIMGRSAWASPFR